MVTPDAQARRYCLEILEGVYPGIRGKMDEKLLPLGGLLGERPPKALSRLGSWEAPGAVQGLGGGKYILREDTCPAQSSPAPPRAPTSPSPL